MIRTLLAFIGALLTLTVTFATAACAQEAPVYELRIYTCEPGKLDALHERFREHTMRIFKNHGMENVAYWTPTDEPKSANTLVYLLRHQSRDAARASWQAFGADPEWKKVARDSREKHGKILAKRPFSKFLAATDYLPDIKPAQRDKLYELRVYIAPPGKLDDLHARFRDHTDHIFAKHGMKAFAYWEPTEKPQSENTLYYVLEFADRAQAGNAWKAFVDDPEWQTAKKASEENGPLLAKRPESTYMRPTDYSPSAAE